MSIILHHGIRYLSSNGSADEIANNTVAIKTSKNCQSEKNQNFISGLALGIDKWKEIWKQTNQLQS